LSLDVVKLNYIFNTFSFLLFILDTGSVAKTKTINTALATYFNGVQTSQVALFQDVKTYCASLPVRKGEEATGADDK
jgi:hypothetical protein